MSNNILAPSIRYFQLGVLMVIFSIIFLGCKKNTENDLLLPPSSVSVQKNSTQTGIEITWSAVIGATGYKIYRNTASSMYGYRYLATTSTSYLTSYTDFTPISGYIYYKVSAIKNESESDLSSSVYYNNIIPTNVSAVVSAANASYVFISWNPIEDAKNYKVYRSPSGIEGTYNYLTSSTGMGALDKNPLKGDNYYKISAIMSSGEETLLSDYANYYLYPYIPLGSPFMNPAYSQEGLSFINLSWSSVPYATSYKLYRSATSNGNYTLIGTYTNLGAKDGSPLNRKNYYKVSAVNSVGETELSGYVYYDFKGYLPAKPSSVVATKNGTKVNLNWTYVPGAIGYNIYRSTNGITGFYSLITTISSGTTTSAIDNSPLARIDNYYKVFSVNSYGESVDGAIDYVYFY